MGAVTSIRGRLRLALMTGMAVAVGLPPAGVIALSTARVASAITPAMSRISGPRTTTSATSVGARPGFQYLPLTPYRILDTRTGQGAPQSPLGPAATLNLRVTGVQGPTPAQVVPSNATAVVMNVTVDQPTQPSFLTVWPQGSNRPLASNLNFVAGDIRPNLAQVALGSTGGVSIFNHAGSAQVIADVQGYFAPAPSTPSKGLFNPLTPARLLDTRTANGGHPTPLGPADTLALQVTGRGGLPATGVEAVVLNLTVTNPVCPAPSSVSCSFLTVWPAGQHRPLVSNVNFGAGQVRANRVIVPVGTGGRVSIFNHAGSTEVVADVGGWFTDGTNPSATGSVYTPISPIRILDTRNGTGGHQRPVGSGQTLALTLAGDHGIPADATAAVASITVTDTTEPSFLTVYPAGEPQPLASDINWAAGETTQNLIETKLGTGGAWAIFNHVGDTDVIADVSGWFTRSTTWVVPGSVIRNLDTAPGSPYAGGQRVAALTFDDGPNPTYTPQILQILARYQTPATFLITGSLGAANPGILRDQVAMGMPIGNHTWTHADLTTLPASQWPFEVDQTTALIQSFTGRPVACLRPTYGRTNAAVLAQIAQRGMAQLLWDVDPRDWEMPGASVIAQHVLSALRPGAIVILHDGGGNRSQTVAALPAIISGIRAAGYQIVPVC